VAGIVPSKFYKIEGNISFSTNKTDLVFTDSTNTVITLKNKDISFSPNLIAGGKITAYPVKDLEASLIYKYVGDQYLDNTQDKS
jgi:iron complex outermembrane receptor protein